MIYSFWQRHQKGAASLLLSVFFSQWCLSGYALKHSISNHPAVVAKTDAVPAWSKKSFRMPLVKSEKQKAVSPGEIPIHVEHRRVYAEKINRKKMDGPGPGQPEMLSFKSLGSDNMVDLFTGDFSYSIPLLDVGGYPVNIHYRSGITMDQEA
ncbi:MAG: hypothetical protein JST63_08105, partial [Bacteroidetes bacterium]|nr:hypothetical protein [Bacteroidota bacterium]